MKVICVDNFDRDTRSHKLICENINKFYGEIFVNALNAKEGSYSDDYYRLVEDDYELYVFKP